MKRYFIRDDDTSFFTTEEDLTRAYNGIWEYGPISLAVIPYCVYTEKNGNKEFFKQDNSKEYFIGNNKSLVSFLRNKIAENKVNIMLHGYNHYYYPLKSKQYPFGIPEFIHSKNQYELIKRGKNDLEELFNVDIKWFIPPSNAVKAETINACDRLNLNIPLVLNLKDRFFSTLLNSPAAFIDNRVNRHSALNKPLLFRNHKEILCTSYTSVTDFDSSYVKKQENMVIATHYWELLEFPHLKNRIMDDLNYYEKKIFSMNCI
jgi:hypothetical protein